MVLAGVAAGSARAQQPIPIVGFVHTGEAKPTADFVAAFSKGLKDAGHVEGQTVSIEYRWADGHLERIPALVLELVRRPVAVLLTGGGDVPPLVAKGATATIPIVFVIGDDPVVSGLVASLNRPGGNVTGATIIASELAPKRVEITLELLPNVSAVAMLLNPNNPQSGIDSDITQRALRAKRKEVHVLHASNREEIDAAFTALSDLKIGALLLIPDVLQPHSNHHPSGASFGTNNLLYQFICGFRRARQLWGELRRNVSADGRLCRENSKRRKARRFASSATN
jgi:putative tryptophan/tyrosine transport system substrate-binding protein